MKKIALSTILLLSSTNIANAACLTTDLCAQISNLQDVAFGTYGGPGDFVTSYDLCVYVQNDDENNYVVTGTGDGTGSVFELTNGTSPLPVTIDFEEDSAVGWVNLTETVATTFANPDTANTDCSVAGNSAKVQITILESDMLSVTSGAYSGNITLLVSPD